MAADHLKTKDIWELLAKKAEIDAAIAEKRREIEKVLTRAHKSRRIKIRTDSTESFRAARAA